MGEELKSLEASVGNEEVQRFMGVVSKFNSLTKFDSKSRVEGFLSLYDKLGPSTKFSEEVKPLCFAWLLNFSAQPLRISDEMLSAVLEKIVSSKAAWIVRGNLPENIVNEAMGALVARLFKAIRLEETAVDNLFYLVEKIGLSGKKTDTLDFLIEHGVDMDRLDVLCDLSCNAIQRRLGKPVPYVFDGKKTRLAA